MNFHEPEKCFVLKRKSTKRREVSIVSQDKEKKHYFSLSSKYTKAVPKKRVFLLIVLSMFTQ